MAGGKRNHLPSLCMRARVCSCRLLTLLTCFFLSLSALYVCFTTSFAWVPKVHLGSERVSDLSGVYGYAMFDGSGHPPAGLWG